MKPSTVNRVFLYPALIACRILLTGCGEKYPDALTASPVEIGSDSIINPDSEYIIVVGDIQSYTYDGNLMPYYDYSLNWILAQSHVYHNIKAVLQNGDISENNVPWQWERFRKSTERLMDELLFVPSTGNHDYTWNDDYKIEDRATTLFNDYAGSGLLEKNIVARYSPESIENIIVRNELFGQRYDIIALEFAPRTEVVEWAADYVGSHKGDRFFLMTHEFLYNDRRLHEGSYAERQILNGTYSTPQNVWDTLVKDNDNVVAVICGHNQFASHIMTPNSAGRDVVQSMFNLQDCANGGDSMIQLWEFPAQGDSARVIVYNTFGRRINDDPATCFTFRYVY